MKLFVIASPESRADRRYKELCERGVETTYEEVLSEMKWRDANDSQRDIAPCVPADDAVMFDNSGLNIEEMVQAAIKLVDGILNK